MDGKRRASKTWWAAVVWNSIFVVAWLLAEFGDDRHWIVAIAGTGITGLIVPGTLLLVAVLALRKLWLPMGASLGLTLLVLTVTGQMRVSLPPTTSGPTLRVMSFNVEHGRHGIERVAELVREQRVDAFAFQELGTGTDSRQIERLRALLPEFTILAEGSRTSGTRLKVLRQAVVPLTTQPYSWTMVDQTVEFEGKPVRLLNVHAPSYLPERTMQQPFGYWLRRWPELSREQTDLLHSELSMIDRAHEPTVLCGDFNMTPVGRRYRVLASRAVDCFAASGSGPGWTMPSGFPMRRIDYVWAFPGIRPVRTWVVDNRSSDHAAVVSELTLP